MVKRMLKRMGRKFNPARMGRKVGKWDIDPFVTRIQVPNGPQNVWTKHIVLEPDILAENT